MDSLHNYDIHEEIRHGETSVVYLATCKRGRMLNRLVAVKKISFRYNTCVSKLASSTALHQSLYHPSILSLLSAFTSDSAQYHVLELCINGTLEELLSSRSRPVLYEGELRGVIKTLADVLVYLRKELIVHRDIKPGNILLSESFRLKVSGFDFAIRLPSETSAITDVCGSPNYVSPEMVAHKPYGMATDLWSLGSLIVTCITAKPAFDAPSRRETYENISSASYDLPPNTPHEVQGLVSSLLQINPRRRISPDQIISHPFLDPALPVQPLRRTASSESRRAIRSRSPSYTMESESTPSQLPVSTNVAYNLSSGITLPRNTFTSRQEIVENRQQASLTKPLVSIPSPKGNGRPWLAGYPHFMQPSSRAPLADVGNRQNQGTLLEKRRSSTKSSSILSGRRIFSAPQSRALSRASSLASLARRLRQNTGADTEYRSEFDSSALPSGRVSPAPQSRPPSIPRRRQRSRSVDEALFGLYLDSETPALTHSDSVASSNTLDKSLESSASFEKFIPCSLGSGAPSMVRASQSKRICNPPPPLTTLEEDLKGSHGCLPPAGETQPSIMPKDDLPGLDKQESDYDQHDVEYAEPAHAVTPVGTIRPVPLKTMFLLEHTHKVVRGQLTVLPSRSLLVDFREGERRRGRPGKEVLVVSPDGTEVKIYSAPHLSTPCCLAEPLVSYALEDLPQAYWKIYNDAARMVEEMKRKIPKLVLFTPQAQCTLMANEPSGDIELIMPPPDSSIKHAKTRKRKQDASPTSETAMRIRLLRQHQVVEIMRYMAPPRHSGSQSPPNGAGEWVKKVVPISEHTMRPAGEEWRRLETSEQAGLSLLWYFTRICEAVDKVPESTEETIIHQSKPSGSHDVDTDDSSNTMKPYPLTPNLRNNIRHVPDGNKQGQSTSTQVSSSVPSIEDVHSAATFRRDPSPAPSANASRASHRSRTCSRSILTAATATATTPSSILITPRPAKFATSNFSLRTAVPKCDSASSGCGTAGGSDSNAMSLSPPTITRYIPSVGWCIRHEDMDSVRYELLLSDGSSVEIDSTGECVGASNWSEMSGGATDDMVDDEPAKVLGAVKRAFADV